MIYIKLERKPLKEHGMSKEQSRQEVQYKMARKMLQILLRRGIVTEEEYEKIDDFEPSIIFSTACKSICVKTLAFRKGLEYCVLLTRKIISGKEGKAYGKKGNKD